MMINPAAAYIALLSVINSVGAVNIRGASNSDILDGQNELRQLNLFLCSCISTIDSSCHPNNACENVDKCTNPKGKDKCNDSGNYVWQTQSTPPPTPAQTPPPAPSSSCGKCVADNYATACSAPTDCPTVSTPGTCSAPSPQPTNGMECTQDIQCEPISGNPRNRGQCNGGSIANSECDTTLTCPPTPPPVSLTPPPTSPPTPNPTNVPTTSPSQQPTSLPTQIPTSSPTGVPTNTPSQVPTSQPTSQPTDAITPPPTPPTQTYCGCPECTSAIWNTDACDVNLDGCHTCGGRIEYLKGLGQTDEQACSTVSDQFPNGPCGQVCNPNVCNGTPEPTPNPTKAPSNPPSPGPSTSSPTEQFFCGCSACTSTIWNTDACDVNLGGCYTCGGRIEYLKGLGQTEEQACSTVSDQFPNGPCGQVCNPNVCNDLVLDEPDSSKLTWSDEFDVDGAPDSTNWDYDLGNGCDKGICGWGNNELQEYTNSPDNVIVANGVLRISAKRGSNGVYTSTRMVSRGKKTFRYGRIRFRARTAGCSATGTWPALWMLPEQWVYGGWPDSGEIDIMEAVGYEENKFHGSVHTGAYNHGINTQKTGSISTSEADWHIFEIDWQVDKIRFAVDNQVYFAFAPDDTTDSTKWPFGQDFHLLLNIAVGGNWGGLYGVDGPAFDGFGQYMEVDWVRAYSS